MSVLVHFSTNECRDQRFSRFFVRWSGGPAVRSGPPSFSPYFFWGWAPPPSEPSRPQRSALWIGHGFEPRPQFHRRKKERNSGRKSEKTRNFVLPIHLLVPTLRGATLLGRILPARRTPKPKKSNDVVDIHEGQQSNLDLNVFSLRFHFIFCFKNCILCFTYY